MATTQIAFGKIGYAAGSGVDVDALRFDSLTDQTTQTMTPSGVNQQSTAQAPSGATERLACRVATDTQVYVALGANPNATAEPRIMVPANREVILMCRPGDKAAIATAP